MDKTQKNKVKVIDDTNMNLLVGAKRGRKKTVADQFEDIAVPTSTIDNNLQKKSSKKVEKEIEIEKTYTKKGYVRPDVTFTDQLSKEQIQEKLEDYTKVDDIYKVPLGVHLRYFTNKDGKLVFRMGGKLHRNTGLPDYLILDSGSAQWSVQVKDTIFYRKMTIDEIKTEYQNIINEFYDEFSNKWI